MIAINTELLSKITILYIEDDDETRKNLVGESVKLFKKELLPLLKGKV